MSTARAAAVAGAFYPDQARDLQIAVDSLLTDSLPVKDGLCPKAIVAPHAGYIYSGPVAASAYALLSLQRSPIQRVVLLGPSHRVAFRGVAISSSDAYLTPLGSIPIDQPACHELLGLPWVLALDEAHEKEHSLEVHLPFLQRSLREFKLIPLVVGDVSAEEINQILIQLWGGEETLVVVSTDLSHYLPYDTCVRIDALTADKIVHMKPTLTGEEACGCRAVNGLLQYARSHQYAQLRKIDVRNSGDTAGDRDRVVGYGAFVLNPRDEEA